MIRIVLLFAFVFLGIAAFAQKIEKEMQYPGQVKVTVIREMRAVSFAK